MNSASASSRADIIAELSRAVPAYFDTSRRMVAVGATPVLSDDARTILAAVLTEHHDLDTRLWSLHGTLTTAPGPRHLGGTDGR
ncbi:hypothetical protein [Nocardia sp. CA-120079]|uniref:hypothetical protein n=1 Tax=Nocardia sp. CA-120079 TaxID=3239974 RepID=UPI003D98A926